MDRFQLPRIPKFNLHGSLDAAETMAAQAERTRDPALRRLLLRSSCEVLDHALRCSARPAPVLGRG